MNALKSIRGEIVYLVILPVLDVSAEVGIASAYPQFLRIYGSTGLASVFVAMSAFTAVSTGLIWGLSARKLGVRVSLMFAMFGWGVSTIALGLFYREVGIALAARAAQGAFSAGFAGLPFIAITQREQRQQSRVRGLSLVETAISVGAISAPMTVGLAISVSAARTFLLLGALVLVLLVVLGCRTVLGAVWHARKNQDDVRTPASEPSGSPDSLKDSQYRTGRNGILHAAFRVAAPTTFAALTAVVLSALETLVPALGESATGSVLAGKVAVTCFECLVVVGVLTKGRSVGLRRTVPVLLGAGFAGVYLFASWQIAVVVALCLLGIAVGNQITMGNELAAERAKGLEEHGMALYATLRISGSFIGPLFMNLGYPLVFAALAVVSLLAAVVIAPAATSFAPLPKK